MRQLTEEEIKKGWEIHNQIKNHDFRKQPELYLLEEYERLFYDKLYGLICGWKVKDIVTKEDGTKDYEYSFHNLERHKCHVPWSKEPRVISIDIWSNPNIALINEAIHDFNGIRWRLTSDWKRGMDVSVLLGKFIETTELMLMIFHKLLEREEITEVKYPKDNNLEGSYYLCQFVQNPKFGNNWTLPWALPQINKDDFKTHISEGVEEIPNNFYVEDD